MFRKISAGLSAIIILCGLLFLDPVQGSSSGKPSNEQSPAARIQANAISQETEALYRYVEQGNLPAANESIRRIEVLFAASSFQGLTSIEGIHAMAEAIVEMKETTARASLDPKQWMISASKLRLAADSLTHPQDGIWLQYYKVVREDLQLMEQSAAQKNLEGIRSSYSSLQQHFEIIRPAVIVQREPEEVHMLESWISYAGGVVARGDTAEVRAIISRGEEMINILFGKKKDEPALAPLGEVRGPWMWQLLFAAFILAALTFAGYRKYRANFSGIRSVSLPKK